MTIYVDSLSAPTVGGGIRTFIDTESWELVTTGVNDFHEPVAEREPLTSLLQEWLADPHNMPFDGARLSQLVLETVSKDRIPVALRTLLREASLVNVAEE